MENLKTWESEFIVENYSPEFLSKLSDLVITNLPNLVYTYNNMLTHYSVNHWYKKNNQSYNITVYFNFEYDVERLVDYVDVTINFNNDAVKLSLIEHEKIHLHAPKITLYTIVNTTREYLKMCMSLHHKIIKYKN